MSASTHGSTTSTAGTTAANLRVLLYSDDRTTREQVRLALGRRLASDLPEIEVFDVATQPAVMKALDTGHYDVMILDGEANPSGGFGIARQVKDEIAACPPVVLLVARRDDAWLATWSGAEGVSSYPIDPLRLPRTVAEVIRGTQPPGARVAQPGASVGTHRDADAPATVPPVDASADSARTTAAGVPVNATQQAPA